MTATPDTGAGRDWAGDAPVQYYPPGDFEAQIAWEMGEDQRYHDSWFAFEKDARTGRAEWQKAFWKGLPKHLRWGTSLAYIRGLEHVYETWLDVVPGPFDRGCTPGRLKAWKHCGHGYRDQRSQARSAFIKQREKEYLATLTPPRDDGGAGRDLEEGK